MLNSTRPGPLIASLGNGAERTLDLQFPGQWWRPVLHERPHARKLALSLLCLAAAAAAAETNAIAAACRSCLRRGGSILLVRAHARTQSECE